MAIEFRPYQIPIFQDNTTGVSILHWARQIGKSYVLAAWSVDRLLSRPGSLVTVLSNSRENGIEFADKCQAVCAEHGATFEASNSVDLETLVTEIRLTVQGRRGRIKVLASNPRTARGFSGDRRVIEYTFGPNVPVLAGVTVQQTPRRGTQQDMIIDQFLIGAGMPLSVTDAAKRYGRAIADPGEPILKLSDYAGANPGSKDLKPISETTFAPDQNRPARQNVSDQ